MWRSFQTCGCCATSGTREQQDVLAAIVGDALHAGKEDSKSHPRARGAECPDPEELARDFDRLQQRLASNDLPETDLVFLRDQLGVLAARVPWVDSEQQRDFLQGRVDELLSQLEAKA